MSRLVPGQTLDGRVALTHHIMRGARADIWWGRHVQLQRDVAIKVFHGAFTHGYAGQVLSFHQEAQLAERLRSAHVSQVLTHGLTPEHQPYLVMEPLRGEDLSMRLARDGRLGLRDTGRLVLQLASALDEAHALGLVHGAITFQSVMLLQSDEICAKLLGFGAARPWVSNYPATISDPGGLLSAVELAAPEQIQGFAIDRRVDLWALAVVAYRALTGFLPFSTTRVRHMLSRIREASFVPPSHLALSGDPIPESVDAWFRVALGYEPGSRFVSAEHLAAAWRETVHGDRPSAGDSGAWRPSQPHDVANESIFEKTLVAAELDVEQAPPTLPRGHRYDDDEVTRIREATPLPVEVESAADEPSEAAPRASAPMSAPALVDRPVAALAEAATAIERPLPASLCQSEPPPGESSGHGRPDTITGFDMVPASAVSPASPGAIPLVVLAACMVVSLVALVIIRVDHRVADAVATVPEVHSELALVARASAEQAVDAIR
jgi:serine/threonine-protein kinase